MNSYASPCHRPNHNILVTCTETINSLQASGTCSCRSSGQQQLAGTNPVILKLEVQFLTLPSDFVNMLLDAPSPSPGSAISQQHRPAISQQLRPAISQQQSLSLTDQILGKLAVSSKVTGVSSTKGPVMDRNPGIRSCHFRFWLHRMLLAISPQTWIRSQAQGPEPDPLFSLRIYGRLILSTDTRFSLSGFPGKACGSP